MTGSWSIESNKHCSFESHYLLVIKNLSSHRLLYINGQSTENRLRSQRTSTLCKIKINNCKLIDF